MPDGNSAGMNINDKKRTRPWLRLCTGALAAGGVAAGTLGLTAGTAQAAPPPAPMNHHHWCPGDHWDNGWGPYQNWNNCRDWDDNYYGGPAGYGPPPWARPMPPPPPWAPWARVVWDNNMNNWGFWNSGVWVPL
jgi:hypothetical protein